MNRSAGSPATGLPDRPWVSIVTPVRNGATYLEQLILSVLGQDYPNIEFIVIDDGSDDQGATVAVLRRYPQVRWWTRPNRGQYATINEGFKAARGDLVTTMGHDDWYVDSGVVSAVVSFVERHPECDAVHGLMLDVTAEGIPLPVQAYQKFPPWMLQYTTFISHSTVFIWRRKLIELALFYDESLRFESDGDWLARLYQSGCRLKRIDRVIFAYRRHPSQLSSRAARGGLEGAEKAVQKTLRLQRYASSPFLGRVASAYVTLHRRRMAVAAAWRRGGAAGLWRAVRKWGAQGH